MASPYDLVRVEDPSTGHQFTTTRAATAGTDFKVLTKPATDDKGSPLPALPRTDKAGRPAPRKSDSIESKKEN